MGKGRGCCDDERKLETYAGDSRTSEELDAAGWPDKKDQGSQCCSRMSGFITDLPFCVAFLIFWVGMIVVAAIAFDRGDPYRLVYGTDYRQELCGKDTEPPGWAAAITRCKNENGGVCPYQSETWSDNRILWLPLPYNGDLEKKFDAGSVGTISSTYFADTFTAIANDPEVALNSGLCVSKCPTYNVTSGSSSSTLSVSSLFSDPATLASNWLVSAVGRVYSYGAGSKGQDAAHAYFFVWYTSTERYHRCISEDGMAYLEGGIKDSIGNIPEVSGLNDAWNTGLTDLEESWRVLAVCGGCAIVFPVIYALLMRCCLVCWVRTALLLIIVLVAGGGVLCYTKHTELTEDTHTDNEDEAKAWMGAAFILWGMAIIIILVILCLWKKLHIAIAIIQEATKVLESDCTLLLVPIITGISILALTAWCVVVWLYIYTIRDDDKITLAAPADQWNLTDSFNLSDYGEYVTQQNMVYYYVFGWLWTMGLLGAIGFFVIAGTTVKWYYSSKGEEPAKSLTCCFGWLGCYGWAFQHIGGLAMGTFLVAVVQFIRFLLYQYTERVKKMVGDNIVATALICCADCCLCILEKCLKWITKNAYVIMAIEGTGFWCACCKLMPILIDNLAIMAFATCISEVVFVIGKLIVTACTVLVCYALLQNEDMAPNVDSGIPVMIIVGISTYLIASIFMYIYSVCVDSMIILVCREMSQLVNGDVAHKDVAMGVSIFEAVTGKDAADRQKNVGSDKHPREWGDGEMQGRKADVEGLRKDRDEGGCCRGKSSDAKSSEPIAGAGTMSG